MPRCTPATSAGDIACIILRAASTMSGRLLRVACASSFDSISSTKPAVPSRSILSASCERVALLSDVSAPASRIGEHERAYLLAIAAPEFKQQIAADRNAHEDGLDNALFPAEPCQIVGQLLHGRGPVSQFGITMRAQIGQEHAIARTQLIGNRVPEVMIQGKRVQQYNVRTAACGLMKSWASPLRNVGMSQEYAEGGGVSPFSSTAMNQDPWYGWGGVAGGAAGTYSGSSGITIHAMM